MGVHVEYMDAEYTRMWQIWEGQTWDAVDDGEAEDSLAEGEVGIVLATADVANVLVGRREEVREILVRALNLLDGRDEDAPLSGAR